MANVIKLKRGTSTPTTSDITSGEVALDTSAKKLFVNDGGTVKEIGGGGGLSSDAQNNTVGGSNAGDSFSGTDAQNNTLIGFNAGTGITTNDFTTAVGSEACTGDSGYNVGIGYEALKVNATTFGKNVAVGFQTARALTTGQQNVVLGDGSGASMTSSTRNVLIGSGAAGSLTSGENHIFIGFRCGRVQETGRRNVGIGYLCMYNSTESEYNVALGYRAAYDLSTGDNNTIIGTDAGNTGTNDLTTGSNNILLGHDAAASSATISNEITLGDGNITKFRIPGLSFSINASAVTNGGAFYENAKTVAADYTLSGSNAMAAGPITINSSVTVTVSSGDTLTIV
tara:strand:- start:619 stop:1641 length:1023 start_codon:yes stop_codon:yes gene_type:complete